MARILVLKKCKKPDDVLIINAAEEYDKGKRQNTLSEDHIKKIVDTYKDRPAEIDRYGQRDAPDDQSIFEYRSDEYDFYVQEGHLPEDGWDNFEHEDYGGDGSNLETKMDKGSTVGS